MSLTNDAIKEYLFEYIKNSKTVPKLLAARKFDKLINHVMDNCYEKIVLMGQKDDALGVFATGLLHYLLTSALISSQRKVEFCKVPIDIVIPDIQTLKQDPKKALLLCIPSSSDPVIIKEKISQLQKIQPNDENIWVILSEDMDVGKKTFVLKDTFSQIIFEIAQFRNVHGTDKFQILRI